MPPRVLSWIDLAEIAVKYAGDPDRRVISLAGVHARVKKSLATDAGFYVHSLDQEYADTKWALKLREHMLLLRQLVDAGQVTIDDDKDPWRSAEWAALLADTSRGCFIYGCEAGPDDIDIRGPVFDDRERIHKACTAHWEGVYGELGRQHPAGGGDEASWSPEDQDPSR